MATKIVGLDLGSHTIKVCEVVSTQSMNWLAGTESVDFAESDQGATAYANAAKRLLERRGTRPSCVRCQPALLDR